jgi:hypothetical protein
MKPSENGGFFRTIGGSRTREDSPKDTEIMSYLGDFGRRFWLK